MYWREAELVGKPPGCVLSPSELKCYQGGGWVAKRDSSLILRRFCPAKYQDKVKYSTGAKKTPVVQILLVVWI